MRPGARSLHRRTIRVERNIETQGSERVQPPVFTVSPRDWCVDVRVCVVYVCVSLVCVWCVCVSVVRVCVRMPVALARRSLG